MISDLPPAPPALVQSIDAHVRFQADQPFTKAIHQSPHSRISLFVLEPNQEITPHTAPAEVLMFVHRGKGSFSVGDRTVVAQAGDMIPVPFGLVHGFKAQERMVVYAVITPNPMANGKPSPRP